MRLMCIIAVALSSVVVGCGPGPAKLVAPADDLASARKGFATELRVRGPAPQPNQNNKPLVAPVGVKEVEYTSGNLKLKGWLSGDVNDGKKRPAVVFLHDDWALGEGDWRSVEPFVKAGFVLFMPMLRGENGNPGVYECFLGEVDDAVAAGRFVASLPGVDASNVFVAGFSEGGVLTCLVSMMPSPYKAAAAIDAWVDMETWAAAGPDAHIPFNRKVPEEVRVRNPIAFANSIRCPLRLYVNLAAVDVNTLLADKAKKAGKDCELIKSLWSHDLKDNPAIRQSITWFGQLAGK